jgi:hypothetical protein
MRTKLTNQKRKPYRNVLDKMWARWLQCERDRTLIFNLE